MTTMDVLFITLRRDVKTDLGTFAAGTVLPVIPSPNDGWLVEMSLPHTRRGVPSHPFEMPAAAAQKGRHLLNQHAVQHDYQFARETLGLSHASALVWIQQGYGVSERQLFRWGLSEREVAS